MSYGVSPQAVLRPSLYYLDRCHTLDATARNPHFPGKGDYHVNSFAGPVGGAAPIIADQAPMIDPFGRAVTYLRVSVTDRCDFRCTYCMAENMTFLPKKDLLTLEELNRLCSAFISKGVRKIRLTGGEPLVRKNIMFLVRELGQHVKAGALDELTLTTNGSQLAKYADELYDSGVRRINVSLDTLNPEKFKAITRWGDYHKVMEGIDAAQKAGLKIKLNAVALKDFNEFEIADMLRFAHGRGMDMTVIETMPMGEIDEDRTDQYLPLSKLRADLEEQFTLTEIPYKTGGPARYVEVQETGGRLGFITPMTHNFCESCNRVRLTCTGTLYMCLGQNDAADLRTALRASENDDYLSAAIDEAITRKPKGHDFIIDRTHKRPAVARHMSVTGG
ncbi:Molybdenum cofactor biosynthesis protein A [Neorhizobium galegae bv. officinalis bv. officinalis str. HAMBI 1141]|uniref:GTP 3',8-cyclase n=2 Tax=Rhizobium/Agrobacterium group TaxID=227290 RepID=A0A068T636_NEOGA|nr:Molybdenum cofactor biosynthesis protein A [Neorhizobium galegae bv. officinalis bv. officinalis str. HAMBI 1141]